MDNDQLAPRGDPAHDRLGKVRPLITHLSNKFASPYEPSKEVAVDEAMIKFQGRSSVQQYMPKKPTKRGIKVWVLGDSTNGYFSRFDVYTGKGEGRVEGLGAHVVKKLTKRSEEQKSPCILQQLLHQLSAPGRPRKGWYLWMWDSQKGPEELSSSTEEPRTERSVGM